ncbi:uncharacterized protein LY79DRAFT_656064 [Colletotrichum navitas]|uniref:Uncharacterized protein n=1 Tax=Colletotrichum navitas TaxID=681940 RepID=A0AAD8V9T6_9PEZI|nr:uncharacterized protein LY79DRAFT_656064 [Colletotrichum navitas]KAK1598339.1 hypothetical protein LY79DRAFT_656064 [Colletotrichum navitas]
MELVKGVDGVKKPPTHYASVDRNPVLTAGNSDLALSPRAWVMPPVKERPPCPHNPKLLSGPKCSSPPYTGFRSLGRLEMPAGAAAATASSPTEGHRPTPLVPIIVLVRSSCRKSAINVTYMAIPSFLRMLSPARYSVLCTHIDSRLCARKALCCLVAYPQRVTASFGFFSSA